MGRAATDFRRLLSMTPIVAFILLATTCLWQAVSAGSAAADPMSDCSRSTGTVVAVDFAHWSGPIVRGCGQHAATGFDLLHDAGFTTAGDDHDGPALICRLGNQAFAGGTRYPTPAEDPCTRTPPTSAYWAYWTAPAGQSSWSLSSYGSMSDVPRPGEVELWFYGSTNASGTSGTAVPTFSPDSLRAHNTAPVASPSASSHPSATRTRDTLASTHPRVTRSTAGHPSSQASPSTGRASASAQAHPTPRRTSDRSPTPAVAAGDSTVPTSAATPAVVDAQPASASRASPGSVVPLVVGATLFVLVAGAGGWAAWRRRRRYG